ncbi:MAG: internalization-related competence protein ComEC/Rec2 [Moraxellaceae bacterium]|jgi:competence protein ComEC|nr:internalization-related competence protein ComEC/Rec2 [Moraxellaceae bacterium]
MGLLLAAMAAGLLLLPLLPVLPPLALPLGLALAFLLAWSRARRPWLLAGLAFCLACAWSTQGARQALEQRIPAAWEGRSLLVRGEVEGLPEAAEPRGARFRFRPREWRLEGEGAFLPGHGRWQLFSSLPGLPMPGSDCRLEVRLKRPHGAANPAGFDFEAWLLSEGVTATGSVRAIQCEPPRGFSMDRLRLRLRQEFSRRYPERPAAGVLLALVSGDRSLVDEAAWQNYSITGVVHLMAISGMHVTMLAAVAAWLLLRLLRLWPRLGLRWPLQRPVMLAGLGVALAYSLLAGFSVPTERTLVMVAVVVLAHFAGRRLPPFQVLLLALVAVLSWSPLAVHAAGFWLSFGAVSVLMLFGVGEGEIPAWRQALHLQFAVTLLLLPLTLWFFDRISWVSPFANLVAVPLVTFGVVPLGLLGFLCWLTGLGAGAGFFWSGATGLVEIMDALMEQFAAWPLASVPFSLSGLGALLWLTLAVVCLLQPASLRLRLLAPAFLLPLWWPPAALSGGQMRVTVIDVGQGLSVLVETSGHRLLYDTGPAMGPRADAGQRHVLPVLYRRGIYHLDALVLSHDHLDHTGGAASVLGGVTVGQGLGVRPAALALPPGLSWQRCEAGQHWAWDGWDFAILYPDADELRDARGENNRSCVLRIRRGSSSILLPGDLERSGEVALLSRLDPGALRANVLVLGHHGSRTSTSAAFLAAVHPDWALASAGYRNTFRHPSRTVLECLDAAAIPWRNTAASGAFTLHFDGGGGIRLEEYRRVSGHYWQANDSPAIFANWRGFALLGALGLNR